MDTVYKTFRAEVKDIDKETGEINLVIPVSTDSMDRDGEIIEPTAFKKTLPKFMKRPVLVSSHDYRDLTKQIGEWTKLKITESGLDGKPKYYINEGNDEADWAFNLASKGMAAFSVGFIPKVWEDGEGEKAPRRTFKEVELLEISQVIVPSNREAIQGVRAKAADPIVLELCDEVEAEIEEPEIEEQKDLTTDDIPEEVELVTKPEETEEFIRIPVRNCKVTATIDISKKEGISALYCGKEKQVETYLFRKDKGWTMEKAKQWVKEHEKGVDIDNWEKTVSQQEILDEIDYLALLIAGGRLSEETEESVIEFAQKVYVQFKDRLPKDKAELIFHIAANSLGYDRVAHYSLDTAGKPAFDGFDMRFKSGAVLNKRNKDRLNQIKRLAQEVLDSASGEEEEEKRSLGDDTPIKEEKNNIEESSMEDILEAIQATKIGG